MKKKFSFVFMLLTLVTMGVCMSSCNKDDDENDGSSSSEYIEVTINGKTYKEEIYVQSIFGVGDFRYNGFCQMYDSDDFWFDAALVYYTKKSTFSELSTTGTYRVIGTDGLSSTPDSYFKNLDLDLSFGTDDEDFTFVSGIHNITEIKSLGNGEYQISATFNCTFKGKQTSNTTSITGKYKMIIEL